MDTKTFEISARLSAIVEASTDAIINKKFDGTIISWNEAAEKIFGYTANEAINKNISIIVPEEFYEEEKESVNKAKNGELIEYYETTRQTKAGNKIPVALTISPIKDNNGTVISITQIARDVSEQKLSDTKEAMLAAIVNSSDDAIISKTLDGIITSWNHAARKMYGYTEAEVIGKHISIIIPADRIDEETMIIENIRKGLRIHHFETVRVRKDKKIVNISLTVSPIKDKRGNIIGASKIARDITEKAEAEKQLLLYTEKLQELNKYKDEFMAIASHELKTPLTIIKANLDVLLLIMEEDINSTFVHKILKQVNTLNKLINDLLDISKIQSGKLELEPVDFNMNILLKEVISDIQLTTQIQIIFNEINYNLSVHADRQRIGLVITNILTNAIKYSPDSKEIFVDAFVSDHEITVRIKDTGIGIPQEDLTNIFSRFYRVSGLGTKFSGSGIGLYISSEIINRHGGKIWAESEVNKGSAFYFSIPASLSEPHT